jgi:hypothetical protein
MDELANMDELEFPIKAPKKTRIVYEGREIGYLQEDGARCFYSTEHFLKVCSEHKPIQYIDEDGRVMNVHPEDFRAMAIEKLIFSFIPGKPEPKDDWAHYYSQSKG